MMMKIIALFLLLLAHGALGKLTLRYFGARGRAEPIRLLLAATGNLHDVEQVVFDRCGDACEDGVVDWDHFKEEHRNSPLLPFGQVPSLSDDGVHLVQSLAIQKYLARKFDFILENTDEQKIRNDILAGGFEDMRKSYGQFVYTAGAKLDDYLAFLHMWLPYFERLFLETEGEYFMGTKMTYLDTMAFDMLESNLRIDPDCLQGLPTLHKFAYQTMANKLQNYINSPQRYPYANGKAAHVDNANNPTTFKGFFTKQQVKHEKQEL